MDDQIPVDVKDALASAKQELVLALDRARQEFDIKVERASQEFNIKFERLKQDLAAKVAAAEQAEAEVDRLERWMKERERLTSSTARCGGGTRLL